VFLEIGNSLNKAVITEEGKNKQKIAVVEHLYMTYTTCFAKSKT
jgi:hypothetical protein